MASIRKRKDGYEIRVFKGKDVNGKAIMEQTTWHPNTDMTEKQNTAALQRFAYEFEQKVKASTIQKGSRKTYQSYINEEWLPDYCIEKMEQSTLDFTTDLLNKFIIPAIGYKKLTDISSKDIESIYKQMINKGYERNGKHCKYSTNYIKRVHQVISSSFTKAYKWRYIEENPCSFVDIPKGKSKKDIKFFTVEQCQTFLDFLNKPYMVKHGARKHKDGTPSVVMDTKEIPLHYKIIFILAIVGGFRREELIALTWNDIDFDNNLVDINKAVAKTKHGEVIKIPKTPTSKRKVSVPSFIIHMIAEYKTNRQQNTEWIFIQADGKRMALDTPNKVLKKIIMNYNITHEDKLPEVTLHGLRHTNATILMNNNPNIKMVSTRLGHSEVRTTLNIYTHPLQSADIEASDTIETLLTVGHKLGIDKK